ncbi:deleted in malignant brain tumors 1 protein-like isoform X2 [Gouania willdenowi]|uniref:deleted in malignant brain tumors 1 protein-like isoform X2 n=1 Tax=Gouania willdenowi TaxID=441366 RepID=UPI001056685F|nr:deleted in malignant brain tumors 1 protein-like isoform X2 [Gouania willdenowi]
MTQDMLILLVLQTVTGYAVSQNVPSPPLRLVGSDNRCSGRVEIFLEGLWGTVCDDLWDLDDAQVVCQQLGCGEPISAPKGATFGPGIGPIWLDDVQCSGNELLITDCTHQGFGLHNCFHDEDASVNCTGANYKTTTQSDSGDEHGSTYIPTDSPTPPNLPVRLVGSNNSCSGRVEIFYEDVWWTVCDDVGEYTHAQVVCRQLECGKAVTVLQNAAFGPGTGPIWMSNVYCTGNESSLAECEYLGFRSYRCGHEDDVSLICEGDGSNITPNNTSQILPVRLVGSNSSCAGRVEVFYEEEWGTVCDDIWGMTHAEVVCRQLGCGRAVSALERAAFGQGTGPIWLDNVQCLGNETSIADCAHQGLQDHNCGHFEDASIICEGDGHGSTYIPTDSPTPPNLPVRLVGSNNSCSGRVEIFYEDVWWTVCDDVGEYSHAQVVCRQLGCGEDVTVLQNAAFGPGTGPIWMSNVYCTGNESSLVECEYLGFRSYRCGHEDDVSLICEGDGSNITPNNTSQILPVRLVGSNSSCAGRVEVFYEEEWGTVCDDIWGMTHAEVVCRQLGCGRAVSALERAAFGQGTGPIWLDNVHCLGNETSIADCAHQGLQDHNCGHFEDASIICEGDGHGSTYIPTDSPTPPTPPNLPVRLVGSNNSCSGRVEIFYEDVWWTVCDDVGEYTHAQVVCRQLGCGEDVTVLQNAAFGPGTGPIWMSNVYCTGNESSLAECEYLGFRSYRCGHEDDVSLICEGDGSNITPNNTSQILPVRLVGSNSSCSGRVEVFYNDEWGTVCDDIWALTHAQVVCLQLGCGRALRALESAAFGEGTGPIWLDNVRCSGHESTLSECSHPGFGDHNCGHGEDASIICEGDEIHTTSGPIPSVRLVGSNSSCSGRVEIFYHGQWGTVCDDLWRESHAQVVCRQLGCGRAVSALERAAFGQGTGPIWLDNVQCSGNESSLTDCAHQGFGSHNCGHAEDASVICEERHNTTQNSTTPSLPVRLVGSNSSCSGRVEVFYYRKWGTVCDDIWKITHAQVICRQLGCGEAVSAPRNAHFGEGTGPIWLDDVQCSGREPFLTHCRHPGFGIHNCGHGEDASVICKERDNDIEIPTAPSTPVRLVGSNSRCSGRVEILFDNQWGTVCDDIWELTHAQVVCRQLACGRAVSAPRQAWFGEGTGPIWLDNVQCSGNESSITDCAHLPFGSHNCGRGEEASVICEDEYSLLQASQLVCSRDQLQVGVPLRSLMSAGLNIFSAHMVDPSCSSYRVDHNILWYQVARRPDICGTMLMTNSTHAIYFNSLFFYPKNNESSSQAVVIPFSCAYPLETMADLNAVKPELLVRGLSESGPKAPAYMNLYRDSSFAHSYPPGLETLPPGSPLYVGVFVNESDSDFAAVLESCYTTDSLDPDDAAHNFLIYNRCPTDPLHVRVVENGVSLSAYFSAEMATVQGFSPYIFLHCRISLCDKRSDNCVPFCRGRKRRSVHTSTQLTPLTIGPITWEK